LFAFGFPGPGNKYIQVEDTQKTIQRKRDIPLGIIDDFLLVCFVVQYIPIPPFINRYFGPFITQNIYNSLVDKFSLAFRSVEFKGVQSRKV
jgi:hypothetical protein